MIVCATKDRRRWPRAAPFREAAVRVRSAVEVLLARGAPHGLLHVWFDRHAEPMHATHITRGNGKRCFDHILVSKHFSVEDAGLDHAVRAKGARTSDHSLVWAHLERRGDST